MRQFFVTLTILSTLLFYSCEKSDDCYDKQMEEDHSGYCFDDCPGVCGCDGQIYCNECYANRNGIKVVSEAPCD